MPVLFLPPPLWGRVGWGVGRGSRKRRRMRDTSRPPPPIPPPQGGGGGGGGEGKSQASTYARHVSTPTPNPSPQGGGESKLVSLAKMKSAFERAHKAQFGFIDRAKALVIEAVSVEAIGGGATFREKTRKTTRAKLPAPARRTRFFSNGK